MAKRKHISWKTKCASALVALGRMPYSDAKEMTEDQLLSLFHWDHNILHETGHEDRDKFWNLTPMFIAAHRAKTKRDAAIIAKGRRIRAKNSAGAGTDQARLRPAPLRIGPGEVVRGNTFGARQASAPRPARFKHKIKSRGFDTRYKRKLDGTVVKRD